MYHGRDMVDIPADFCVTMWKTDRKTASCVDKCLYRLRDLESVHIRLRILGGPKQRSTKRMMHDIKCMYPALDRRAKKAVLWNGRRIFFGEISKPDLEAV